MLRNQRPTGLCGAYSGNRISSKISALVRCIHAWKEFHAKAVAIGSTERATEQATERVTERTANATEKQQRNNTATQEREN